MSPERTRARPVLNVGPRSVSVRAVAEDFYALAEDAAQVSVAQGEGTSDAKALAQYNADVPLYAEYLVGCSSGT